MELESVKKEFAQFVRELQERVIEQMRALDPGLVAQEDHWQRQDAQGAPGGGGRTIALAGEVFEKAGVNTSEICGAIDPQFARELPGAGEELWATGISLILHPKNPKVPTVHANFRMIQHGERVWFGGGADLTPFYPYPQDFRAFHAVWAQACAPYGQYLEMKAECDRYFTNHHRQGEMRGVGGIFFDHWERGGPAADSAMVRDLAEHFIPSYFPLAAKRIPEKWGPADEEFQLHRRGRYVEFNLIHDRGTLFGLKTNGRTESILISLPPRCRFSYNYQPAPQTPQAEMMEYYYPRPWVD